MCAAPRIEAAEHGRTQVDVGLVTRQLVQAHVVKLAAFEGLRGLEVEKHVRGGHEHQAGDLSPQRRDVQL